MKLDKEVLIKQHFWFLLAPFALFVLIGLILLWTSAAGAIDEKQKDFDKVTKSLKDVKTPRNAEFQKLLDTRDKLVEAQKGKIWRKLYEDQKSFMIYPSAPKFAGMADMRFGDPLAVDQCVDFGNEHEHYAEVARNLLNVIKFVDKQGEGVVQLKEGVLRTLPNYTSISIASDEIWLALEDIWVQKELLRIVKAADDTVAQFLRQDGAAKPDKTKNEVNHQIFANSDWKLDLTLVNASNAPELKTRLTNLSSRRQSLGVLFEVSFKGVDGDPYGLFLDGEPVSPDQTIDAKPVKLESRFGVSDGFAAVIQHYDWRTAPIKRIDLLKFGDVHGHRTFPQSVVGPSFVKSEDPKGAKPGTSAGSGSTSGGGTKSQKNSTMNSQMQRSREMSQQGGMDSGGGQASNSSQTTNGLELMRYSEVLKEVRRTPVVLDLIVEQNHIQEVLAAVTNSPLRIQTTQWHWTRFKGDIRPKTDSSNNSDLGLGRGKTAGAGKGNLMLSGGPGAGGKSGLGGGGPAESMGFQGAGMMGPKLNMGSFMNGAKALSRVESEEQDWDLVELTVYGIASLYEKPDDAQTAKAGTTQAAEPEKSGTAKPADAAKAPAADKQPAKSDAAKPAAEAPKGEPAKKTEVPAKPAAEPAKTAPKEPDPKADTSKKPEPAKTNPAPAK